VVKCSGVLQCSDGLSNKVSNIIRRLMDNIKLLLICILRVLLSQYFFVNVYMVLFLRRGTVRTISSCCVALCIFVFFVLFDL
jgi:hypothetical protein